MVNYGALIALVAVIAFFLLGGIDLIRTGFNQIKSGSGNVSKGGGSPSDQSNDFGTIKDFGKDTQGTTKINTNVSNIGSGGVGITPQMLIKQKFNAETKTGFDVSSLSGGKVIDNSINMGLPNFANTGNFSRGSPLELLRAKEIADQDLAQQIKIGNAGHKAGFDFVTSGGLVV